MRGVVQFRSRDVSIDLSIGGVHRRGRRWRDMGLRSFCNLARVAWTLDWFQCLKMLDSVFLSGKAVL